MKKILLIVITALCLSAKQVSAQQREIYQLTVYHFSNDQQEKILDEYLEKALQPALLRLKMKHMGVFKPLNNDTASRKKIYVLIPFSSLNTWLNWDQKISKDPAYQTAGASYISATKTNTAYDRMENIILKAFSLAPKSAQPPLKGPREERVYELRSYECPSEKLFRNKVHMFNEGGEIGIFKRLGFNAVFYGEVLAGGKMPNLMYMTSFENKADRDAHWKSFGGDAAWKKLSADPFYKDNVSHIDITFLRPASYSSY